MGSGLVIFKGSNMIAKGQLKLKPRCSNNQAEQFAILKALESIETFNKIIITPSTAIIYTDSRISLDSLQNPKNHAFLVLQLVLQLQSQ